MRCLLFSLPHDMIAENIISYQDDPPQAGKKSAAGGRMEIGSAVPKKCRNIGGMMND